MSGESCAETRRKSVEGVLGQEGATPPPPPEGHQVAGRKAGREKYKYVTMSDRA